MVISLLLGVLLGGLVVLVAEVVVLFWFLKRLEIRNGRSLTKIEGESSVPCELDPNQSIHFLANKKGIIWVLDPDKVPRVSVSETISVSHKEQKSKKEFLEAQPVKKFARIEGCVLIITDDAGQSSIPLEGCNVETVSAGILPSRKWAKRFPIRVENKNSAIYNGSNMVYLYAETSWDKEAWCKALRYSSSIEKTRKNWYNRLADEFHHYLTSLNTEYLMFTKPHNGHTEQTDKAQRTEAPSKVRVFLRKLARRDSKAIVDGKSTSASLVAYEERRLSFNSSVGQDKSSHDGMRKSSSAEKTAKSSSLGDSLEVGNERQLSDVDFDVGAPNSSEGGQEKCVTDEGTLCWNLLFSRLFFDLRTHKDFTGAIHARVQRILSNLRVPSYIGGITCTKLDIGNLPPNLTNMRALPVDMNDAWAVEVDIEYAGGLVLDIETRLEVGEQEFQKNLMDNGMSNSTEDDASNFLKGLEDATDQFGEIQGAAYSDEKESEYNNNDDSQDSKATNWRTAYLSRWRTMVNKVVDHVSQVPLSLKIKVLSLHGTLRIHIKPPPSDLIWFSFTSMPQIEWDLQSYVGDHRIANVQIANLIGNKIKGSLKDNFVLPNGSCLCISWMLAEKDDWVPYKVAPFIWIHQDISDTVGVDPQSGSSGGAKSKGGSNRGFKRVLGRHQSRNEAEKLEGNNSADSISGGSHNRDESLESLMKDAGQTSDNANPRGLSAGHETPIKGLPFSSSAPALHEDVTPELKVPLLRSGSSKGSLSETESFVSERSNSLPSNEMEENEKPKGWRRAKMVDLGKKVGEKTRHIGEKGRHLVEKMRRLESNSS